MPEKKEVKTQVVRSAGGVLYKMVEGRPYVALIATKGGERWGLPKGLVERGEDAATTALREVREETGLSGEVVEKLKTIDYWFYLDRQTRQHKFVDFYLLRYTGGETTDHDWEVEAVQWFPIEEALERASYSTEREVLRLAAERLGG